MFEEFVLEKKFVRQQDTKNFAPFASAKPAFGKFAYSAGAVNEKEKIMQNSGLLENN